MEMIGGMVSRSKVARSNLWRGSRCVLEHRQQGNVRRAHVHAEPGEDGMHLAAMVGLMIEHLEHQDELGRGLCKAVELARPGQRGREPLRRDAASKRQNVA